MTIAIAVMMAGFNINHYCPATHFLFIQVQRENPGQDLGTALAQNNIHQNISLFKHYKTKLLLPNSEPGCFECSVTRFLKSGVGNVLEWGIALIELSTGHFQPSLGHCHCCYCSHSHHSPCNAPAASPYGTHEVPCHQNAVQTLLLSGP